MDGPFPRSAEEFGDFARCIERADACLLDSHSSPPPGEAEAGRPPYWATHKPAPHRPSPKTTPQVCEAPSILWAQGRGLKSAVHAVRAYPDCL